MLGPSCEGRKLFLQMEEVFSRTSCKVEFINSATKMRALLGTSEFFLINATNADFIA